MSTTVPSEHAEQVTFISEFRRLWPGVLIFAIPNGGLRGKLTAAKLKREGVVSGVPDMFIPAWNVWVEMKRQKGGVLSATQKEKINYLDEVCGHRVLVVKGWRDGMKKIGELLNEL